LLVDGPKIEIEMAAEKVEEALGLPLSLSKEG
jgi:hypothetical protein